MTARKPKRPSVASVIRAALKAGLPPGSFAVEVGDGIVRLLPANATAPASGDPFDAELAEWDKRHGYG